MKLERYTFTLDWNNLKPIAEELLYVTPQESLERNAYTSWANPIQNLTQIPELKEYYNFIIPKVIDFLQTDNIEIESTWFSKYVDGGHIIPHTHLRADAVACHYIEFPENAGNLEFIVDGIWQEITISEGDVVIFQAHMKHKSQPNKSGKERWTLTTNFKTKKII